jgi:hypothetical protein
MNHSSLQQAEQALTDALRALRLNVLESVTQAVPSRPTSSSIGQRLDQAREAHENRPRLGYGR